MSNGCCGYESCRSAFLPVATFFSFVFLIFNNWKHGIASELDISFSWRCENGFINKQQYYHTDPLFLVYSVLIARQSTAYRSYGSLSFPLQLYLRPHLSFSVSRWNMIFFLWAQRYPCGHFFQFVSYFCFNAAIIRVSNRQASTHIHPFFGDSWLRGWIW